MADADAMSEIERMLSDLMVSNNWSKTKLKAEVQERGICLRCHLDFSDWLEALVRVAMTPHGQPPPTPDDARTPTRPAAELVDELLDLLEEAH